MFHGFRVFDGILWVGHCVLRRESFICRGESLPPQDFPTACVNYEVERHNKQVNYT